MHTYLLTHLPTQQDEGAYDRYLDQDEWYAEQLAQERRRELDRDRQRQREREG